MSRQTYAECPSCGKWTMNTSTGTCEIEGCASYAAGARAAVGAAPASNGESGRRPRMELDGDVPRRGVAEVEMTHLLSTPLGVLLGVELDADLYARNGFRFVGARAGLDGALLEGESQKFRNLLKLSPAAVKSCIQTGYDAYLTLAPEDVRESLANLQNPRQRMIHELFWPHVAEELFGEIKRARHISSPRALEALTAAAAMRNGRDGAIYKHALALVYHNQALANELQFITGAAEWSDEHWTRALAYWGEVLCADVFWDYLSERAAGFDDPRITPEDIGSARGQLPAVLLGFNALFARLYAKAGAHAACYRHLAFIDRSGLPAEAKEAALVSTVKTLAVARLEPLIQRIEGELLSSTNRMSRPRFDSVCAPVLEEALAVRRYLVSELRLPETLVKLAAFDRLCQTILDALNRKIDYDTDDRSRCILYSIIVTKRMLALPLSSAMRQKIEKSVANDTEILYRGFLTKSEEYDPTECWFLASQEPDPDASFVFPVYKITETRGASVRFETRQLIVPRSKRAKLIHEGKLKAEDVPEESLDAEGRALLAQIREAEARCKDAVLRISQERDAEVARAEESARVVLRSFSTGVDAQAKADEEHLREIQKQLDQKIRVERRRCDTAVADCAARWAAPLSQANAAYDETVERNSGLNGGSRLEAPAAAGYAAGAAVAAFVLAEVIAPGPLLWALPAVGVGLSLGVIIGMVFGRLVRKYRVGVARAAVLAVERERDDAFARLKDKSDAAMKTLRQQSARAGAAATQRLKAVAAEKENLRAKGEARLKEIRKKHHQAIEKLEQEASARLKLLRQRLTDRIKTKPESAKNDFPAYKRAKSSGYKDGKEPSDYEVNNILQREIRDMMNSLDPMAKLVLQQMVSALSSSEANKLLAAILEMSPAERNRRLRSALNL